MGTISNIDLVPLSTINPLTPVPAVTNLGLSSTSDVITLDQNRPRSIYQYSSMASGLSGQNCKFLKFLLSHNSQKGLGYKEKTTRYRSFFWKPCNHVRLLIYRRWTGLLGLSNSSVRYFTDRCGSLMGFLCYWITVTWTIIILVSLSWFGWYLFNRLCV